MTSKKMHYLLFAEASRNQRTAQTWRFVLQNLATQKRFAASDTEFDASGERLELLAVIRGLEALEGPAKVTLVTKSRYVSRGIRLGLNEWRANNWCWERFGKIVAIRDQDLWQRVDRAFDFHQVECQTWHFEESMLDSSVASSEQLEEPLLEEPSTDSFLRYPMRRRQANRVRPGQRRGHSYRPSAWPELSPSVGPVVGASA